MSEKIEGGTYLHDHVDLDFQVAFLLVPSSLFCYPHTYPLSIVAACCCLLFRLRGCFDRLFLASAQCLLDSRLEASANVHGKVRFDPAHAAVQFGVGRKARQHTGAAGEWVE